MPRDDRSSERKGVADSAGDIWELTKRYAQQETIDPLRGLGRFLAYGLAGSLLLGGGVVLLLLGILRGLQTETGSTFTGNLSWIPYLITLAVGLLLAALAISRISRR